MTSSSAAACVTSLKDYRKGVRKAENELHGVDIVFKQSAFVDLSGQPAIDGDGLRYPRVPNRIEFNTCLPDQYLRVDDPDEGYRAYRVAVHEAGHALGLSDWSLGAILKEHAWGPLAAIADILAFWSDFDQTDTDTMSHPTIEDAAMNYDSRTDTSGLQEPDCSPHPFDIAAIYALYQKLRP